MLWRIARIRSISRGMSAAERARRLEPAAGAAGAAGTARLVLPARLLPPAAAAAVAAALLLPMQLLPARLLMLSVRATMRAALRSLGGMHSSHQAADARASAQ